MFFRDTKTCTKQFKGSPEEGTSPILTVSFSGIAYALFVYVHSDIRSVLAACQNWRQHIDEKKVDESL